MNNILKGRLAAIFLLIFGTIHSITSKTQLDIKSIGYNGNYHKFQKPGIQSLFIFLGISLSLIINNFNKSIFNIKYSFKYYLLPIFSSICSSITLYLMVIGLEKINVSIYMMIRGSLPIFSTIFSIIFLKKKILKYQWFGIFFIILSLIIVGFSGIKMNNNNNNYTWKEKLFGIFLVLIGQIFHGIQFVYDEYLLKNIKLPILFVLGMEGIWGCIIFLFIVAPLSFIIPGKDPSILGSSLENIFDTFIMLSNNSTLIILSILCIFSVCFYDISGMTVTGLMSSIHRTIFESLRPLTTWIVMLILNLINENYGEKWVNWSWLELFGFLILIFASLLFNNIIKVTLFQ